MAVLIRKRLRRRWGCGGQQRGREAALVLLLVIVAVVVGAILEIRITFVRLIMEKIVWAILLLKNSKISPSKYVFSSIKFDIQTRH